MRHRSPRPVLDLLRWRPSLPPRLRALPSDLWSRPGVILGTALVTVTGVSTGAAVVFDDGTESRTSVSRVPTELRTGGGFSSNLSRGATARPSLHLDTTKPGPAVSDPADVLATLSDGPSTTADQHAPASQAPARDPQQDSGSSAGGPAPADPKTPDSSPHAPTAPTADASDGPAPTASADRTAPRTTGLSPSSQNGRWVATFSADEPASFRCWLDGVPLGSCTSPLVLGPLVVGEHELRVVATDEAGNRGSPARATWTIPAGPTDSPPTSSESPVPSPSATDASPSDPSSPTPWSRTSSSATPWVGGEPTQTGSPHDDTTSGEHGDGSEDGPEDQAGDDSPSGSGLLSALLD
jgi:hypothetical protein